jgi:hypothetical protein
MKAVSQMQLASNGFVANDSAEPSTRAQAEGLVAGLLKILTYNRVRPLTR